MSTQQNKNRDEDKKKNSPQSSVKKTADKKTGSDKKDSNEKSRNK